MVERRGRVMDISRQETGRVHLTLGPVERKIVTIAASIIVMVLGWFALAVLQTKEAVQKAATQDSVSRISEQQAVMTARLSDLTMQMSDVPGMKTTQAEHRMQLEQNRKDIKKAQRDIETLRSLRNLR